MPAFSDVLGDLRTWLRGNANVAAQVAGRVFFRIPDGPVTYPLIRLYMAGGGVQSGEAPVRDVRVGIDIWGAGAGGYAAVTATANAVAAELHTMAPGTRVGSTIFLNADVDADVDAPDPATGQPRKMLGALVTSIAA